MEAKTIKIDLDLFDVIKKGQRRATVIEITPVAIIAKENVEKFATAKERRKRITIDRERYADGSSGWSRVDLPKVTVSHIGGKDEIRC